MYMYLYVLIFLRCYLTACFFCLVLVVVGLARQELKKYNLVGWLPTFVSDAGGNVRRALAGKVTRDMFREGGNMADWARCVCHMLHNIVSHGLERMKAHAPSSYGLRKLNEALER